MPVEALSLHEKQMSSGQTDVDTLLRAVADTERRQILHILLDDDLPVTMQELATTLVAYQSDTTRNEPPSGKITKAYTRLYHLHLPQLADAGVIEFEQDKKRITSMNHDGIMTLLDTIITISIGE